MTTIGMKDAQRYLEATAYAMQTGGFDRVVPQLVQWFGAEDTQRKLQDYHIYDRDHLWDHPIQRGKRLVQAFSSHTDVTEVDHLTTVRRYLDVMGTLQKHPDTRYWAWDQTTIKATPVSDDLAKQVTKRLVLSVNLKSSVDPDEDEVVRPRVHRLMDKGRTPQALSELYCLYGDMVTTELEDMGVQGRSTTLYQLQSNLQDTVEDWNVDEDRTDELKVIIHYLDKVERNNGKYWTLGEDDTEEPRPFDKDDMDILINNVVQFSAED